MVVDWNVMKKLTVEDSTGIASLHPAAVIKELGRLLVMKGLIGDRYCTVLATPPVIDHLWSVFITSQEKEYIDLCKQLFAADCTEDTFLYRYPEAYTRRVIYYRLRFYLLMKFAF